MTAQTPEILHYRGRQMALCEQPLYPYLMKLPRKRRPSFVSTSSDCWRGYVGTWEIRNGWLHLVALKGDMETEDGCCDATLKRAFPWVKNTLLVKSFSGMARCSEGRLLTYVHAGFASIYERDRMLNFDKGQLIDEHVILNPPPPLIYRIAPDGSRICVTGMNTEQDEEIEDPLKGEDFDQVYKVWAQPPEDFWE